MPPKKVSKNTHANGNNNGESVQPSGGSQGSRPPLHPRRGGSQHQRIGYARNPSERSARHTPQNSRHQDGDRHTATSSNRGPSERHQPFNGDLQDFINNRKSQNTGIHHNDVPITRNEFDEFRKQVLDAIGAKRQPELSHHQLLEHEGESGGSFRQKNDRDIRQRLREMVDCLTLMSSDRNKKVQPYGPACPPFIQRILDSPITERFKAPTIEQYDGESDPMDHLETYKTLMMIQGAPDAMLCKVFPTTLKGSAREWYSHMIASVPKL